MTDTTKPEFLFTDASSGVIELSVGDFSTKPWNINVDNARNLVNCGFVFYYAHWCPYCIKAVPIIEEVAKKNPHAFIAAFSCKAGSNESHFDHIQKARPGFLETYPTIHFYKEIGGVLTLQNTFESTDRTVGSLTQFLVDNHCTSG